MPTKEKVIASLYHKLKKVFPAPFFKANVSVPSVLTRGQGTINPPPSLKRHHNIVPMHVLMVDNAYLPSLGNNILFTDVLVHVFVSV